MRARLEMLLLTLLFVLTAVVFRLPQLTSGQVALDGDEAVVGLMARDLLDGRGLPIFFYGQRHGLAVFEVLPLAAAFHVFGITPIVVKATMLALWVVGGLFSVWAASRLGGRTAGALVGLLLATMPVWIPWSMKARGGYVTAFWASQLTLWVLAGFLRSRLETVPIAASATGSGDRAASATHAGGDASGATGDASGATGRPRSATSSAWGRPLGASASPGLGDPLAGFVLGLALVIVILAQPLFLIPLLPFFVYIRPVSAWLGLLAGGGALAAPLVARLGTANVSWTPRIFGPFDPNGIVELPFRVTTALGGYYYYLVPGEPPDIIVWGGRIFAALGFLGVVYALLSRARDEWTDALWASAVGILTFFLVVLFIRPEQFAYRYFLPLGASLALLLGLVSTRLLGNFWGRNFIYVSSALLFGLAASSTWAGRNSSLAVAPGDERGSETLATRALIEHLEERGIENAYVLDPMYQWILIFETGRGVKARWEDPVDRLPEISRAVDEAYVAGEPVALIGDARFAPRLREALDGSGWNRLRMDVVENRHFILEDPPRTLLDALEFRFAE